MPRSLLLCSASALALASCLDPPTEMGPSADVTYTEKRQVCAHRTAQRRLLWGDLHVHTARSWDAYGYHVRVTPDEAYAFARGGQVMLAPLDAAGKGTRPTKLGRPLDFAAVTDHSEFFGELRLCITPGSAAYDSATCKKFRQLGTSAVSGWGMQLIDPAGKKRFVDVCGADGKGCEAAAETVWKEIQQAAEKAYDRSSSCSFTSFVGYEYTATPIVSNQHRNVIFRNASVTRLPSSYYEEPEQWGLWKALKQRCLDAGSGCDLVSIPHNPNWSNGNQFFPDFAEQTKAGSAAQAAALRGEVEPLLELFQHKGDGECMNGLSGADRKSDPHCGFEKIRFPPDVVDCGVSTGWGGVNDMGCISRYDYLRGILLQGLHEHHHHGVNPFRLGVIGATDTHNGTPGNTWEHGWPGHVGTSDDTAAERLGPGNMTHRGLVNNPGGLAAVWSVENSRDAIFDAIRRREVYATSGTRIELRFFGGWDGVDLRACEQADLVEHGYRKGVAMGGVLRGRSGGAPRFIVQAAHDPGSDGKPGALLQQAQIVKGWIDAKGGAHERVYNVAGSSDSAVSVDPTTCKASGSGGAKKLCAVWSDPAFDAGERAFYYLRVLENPTCRWSAHLCNSLAAQDRPPGCTDPNVEQVIQERAWSSPIWYDPS